MPPHTPTHALAPTLVPRSSGSSRSQAPCHVALRCIGAGHRPPVTLSRRHIAVGRSRSNPCPVPPPPRHVPHHVTQPLQLLPVLSPLQLLQCTPPPLPLLLPPRSTCTRTKPRCAPLERVPGQREFAREALVEPVLAGVVQVLLKVRQRAVLQLLEHGEELLAQLLPVAAVQLQTRV